MFHTQTGGPGPAPSSFMMDSFDRSVILYLEIKYNFGMKALFVIHL